jgi:hypothetical protein
VRKQVGARVKRTKRGKTRLIKVSMFGASDFHILCLDYTVTRVIIAVTQQNGVPSNWIKLAGPLLQRLDDPRLASEGAKEANVRDLLEYLCQPL